MAPTSSDAAEPVYRIGCPVWATAAWVGSLYTSSRRERWLAEYSSVFATVEGNSTFYGLPSMETISRWARDTPDGFEFVLKFPRDVSHEGDLRQCQAALGPFLQILEQLADADRLGPAFLQLPPYFASDRLGELTWFLERLPEEFPYAVEVRNADFYSGGSIEDDFDALLEARGVDRVLLDSRPLYSKPASDATEHASQNRKPRLKFRDTVTGSRPILRLIGRNRLEETEPWLGPWARKLAGWIRLGLSPYIFTHTPNDAFAPMMARRFHELLRGHLPELPELPAWPGESVPKPPVQKQLF